MSEHTIEDLKEYVQKYRKEHFTFDEVRSSLLDQGCKKKLIEEAITAIQEKEKEEKNKGMNQNKGTTAIMVAYGFSIFALMFFISQTGLSGQLLYTPFSTFFSLLNGDIHIQWIFLALSLLFLCISFACYLTLQFKNVSMRSLYLLPIIYPLACFTFHGFSRFALVAAIALAGVHYYIIIDVEHRKQAFKKILPYSISTQTISRVFFPSFLIIASFVGLITLEDATYSQLEVDGIFSSAGFDTGSVETLHQRLEEKQLENTYQVLETVENALLVSSQRQMSAACSVEVEDTLEQIDRDARNQLQNRVKEGAFLDGAQVEKLESLTRLVQRLKSSYPLFAGVFSLMFMVMIKRLLEPIVSGMVWVLVRLTS